MKNIIIMSFVCFCLGASSSAGAAVSQPIQFSGLSVTQGTSFNSQRTDTFGHLISLKVGPNRVPGTLSVSHPTLGKNHTVVGILSSLMWSGDRKAPISLKAFVTKPVAEALKTFQKDPYLSTRNVEFEFAIFKYDSQARKYFITAKSFFVQEKGIMVRLAPKLPKFRNKTLPLWGKFVVNNRKADLNVESQSDAWSLASFSVRPDAHKAQEIVFASKPKAVETLKWSKKPKPASH